MKKTGYILLLTILVSATSVAQELTWHTDLNKAIDVSVKENKNIMLFFTGSDWCGWCIKLQNQVLKTSHFKEWAQKNVVLVELDFPRRKAQDEALRAQNRDLQRMFKVSGFPSIHFVKPEKKPGKKTNLKGLGSTGYVRGGALEWLAVANEINSRK